MVPLDFLSIVLIELSLMSFSAWWTLSQQKTYCNTCGKRVSEGILGALDDYVICEDCLNVEKQKMKVEEKKENKGIISLFFDTLFGEDESVEKPNTSPV